MNRSDSSRSILDRISSIHQHGEKWKERLSKAPDEIMNPRPISVYNIQEQLQTNQFNWKSRIEEKDVNQFTSAYKLSSVLNKENQSSENFVANDVCKDDKSKFKNVLRLVKGPSEDLVPVKITLRSDKAAVINNCNIDSVMEVESKLSLFDNNNQQQVRSHQVTIPQMSDKGLSGFFNDCDLDILNVTVSDKAHTTHDFDEVIHNTDLKLKIQKRSTKPRRNVRETTKNPIKKLNERLDIVNEYVEVMSNYTEVDVQHHKIDHSKKNTGLLKDVLVGLSRKVDFSRVKLKRTDSGHKFDRFMSPYKDLMLISVKGRKRVQLRLVEPVASSINCGDCYLLVTATRVFVWQGMFANVIETNKANEIGSYIARYKGLHYKGVTDRPTILKSNESQSSANVVQFWSCLKYDQVQQCNNPGAVDEDEIYEQRIQTTNMVFEVIGDQLIPLDEYWGRWLSYKLLTDKKVFIFDFGSELYQWSGIKADGTSKLNGKHLLMQLWKRGYDYEQCSINPLDPLPESQDQAISKKAVTRPDWTIVGIISQKLETILFKEKFSDWPDSSRLIGVADDRTNNDQNEQLESELKPADLEEVLKTVSQTVNLTIDGKFIGRGGYFKIIEDGISREFDVHTKSIETWHIVDNEAVKIEPRSVGQFFSEDSYIIRWDFELKRPGHYYKSQTTFNVNSSIFFWQGRLASVTDRTACAINTINLDKDKVTQIMVNQHEEMPAFCRLFDGSMVIYQGKMDNIKQTQCQTRMFIVRGEVKEESHLIEVACQPESLRDRSCFLILKMSSGNGYLWYGRLSSEKSHLCAKYCIESLNKRKPLELGLTDEVDIRIQEIRQGEEHRLFWQDISAVKRWKSSNSSTSLEPICGWLVSSISKSFNLIHLNYPLSIDDNSIPSFPLLQSMLYNVSQPALAIVVILPHIYLWQGWCPMSKDTDPVTDNDIDRYDWDLPKNRITAEKLAALKSLNCYLRKHNREEVKASIIYAGLEPSAFQELFPFWEVNETAKLANIKKGYQMYQEDSITETLTKYLTERFTVDRLRSRPLPECVLISKLEWYLHDDEFKELFKMTKDEFYSLLPWKRLLKKKEVNL